MTKHPLHKTNVFIALQYLGAKKKQSFLAIAGVLLGVATFIIMVNFMTGVNDFLDDAVFKGSPDVIIKPKNQELSSKKNVGFGITSLKNVHELNNQLKKHPNVKAFASQTNSPAILISNSDQLPGSLNGIFPLEESNMVNINRRLIEGSGFTQLSKNDILLGVSIAKQLQVSVGDTLKIILPNGKNNILNVSGIFSFGITTIDNIRTYASAEMLQNLLQQEGIITHINVKLKNRNNLNLKSILLKNSNKINVEDWKESNKTIVIGNKVRDILTWSISFALLLVAGFGIYNIQNSAVIEKRKDIAVLKTMGFSSNDIVFIFLIQTIFIGVIGAFLGLGLGYLVSYFISITPLDTTDFIIVETYPINFNITYYLLGFFFGVLTTILSGYFPSKKASKVDPVTIIRGV